MYSWSAALDALMQYAGVAPLIGVLAGTVIGFVIGLLPGASATMGVALMVPFTYNFDTTTAIAMLMAVYVSAIWAGSICAILVNVPGTPASAATTFDGYPMSLKGQAGRALAASSYSSTIGAFTSGVILIVLTPVLAKVALGFGPFETGALALFGLSIVSVLSGGSALKGWAVALVGLLVATIGQDPQQGVPRFTFGDVHLLSGVSVIAVLVGIFSIPEAMFLVGRTIKFDIPKRLLGSPFLKWADLRRIMPTTIRSTVIGSVLGITPAVGPETATFLGYTVAKRFSRHRENMGKGEIDGVAASEAASCAVLGASLVPMLALGIPGSAEAAALQGGLLIHGIRPGPALYATQGGLLWLLLVGFMVAVVAMYLMSLLSTVVSPLILRLPSIVLAVLLVALAIVGTFSLSNDVFDVYVMFGAGLFSFFLRVFGFSPVPLILSIILGPLIEVQLAQAHVSSGSWLATGAGLGGHPIAIVLLVLAVVALGLPLLLRGNDFGSSPDVGDEDRQFTATTNSNSREPQ